MMYSHQKSYVEDSLDLRLGILIQSIKGLFGSVITNMRTKSPVKHLTFMKNILKMPLLIQ